MRKVYGRAVWNTLREYGVWQPGTDVKLGDYGVIEEGCFQQFGNIFNSLNAKDILIRTATLENILVMSDHGVKSQLTTESKEIGNVEISFKGRAGVVVSADGIVATSVSDIAKLNKLVSTFGNWKRNYRIITSVRRCNNFSVFATGSQGGSIKIQAKIPVLESFFQGISGAGTQLSVTGATGLSLTGKDGAISIQAHKRVLWGNDLKRLNEENKDVERETLVPVIEEVN